MLVSPRFDGGFSGLLSETRYKGASCALTGIPLAHLCLSKLAAGNLPVSGAICNPSPRFNGGRFRSTEPNAYILRNTLSGLRFALVMYYCVHSLRQIRALRVLLVSTRFDVTEFARPHYPCLPLW